MGDEVVGQRLRIDTVFGEALSNLNEFGRISSVRGQRLVDGLYFALKWCRTGTTQRRPNNRFVEILRQLSST
jgi:hypothetical protein